jgi:hypothetical protein
MQALHIGDPGRSRAMSGGKIRGTLSWALRSYPEHRATSLQLEVITANEFSKDKTVDSQNKL